MASCLKLLVKSFEEPVVPFSLYGECISAAQGKSAEALLSKFGSGKEEDRLAGYLNFLKVGPSLLRFVPGEKAADVRLWLEAYSYWNQGGAQNVETMLRLIAQRVDDAAPTPE